MKLELIRETSVPKQLFQSGLVTKHHLAIETRETILSRFGQNQLGLSNCMQQRRGQIPEEARAIQAHSGTTVCTGNKKEASCLTSTCTCAVRL